MYQVRSRPKDQSSDEDENDHGLQCTRGAVRGAYSMGPGAQHNVKGKGRTQIPSEIHQWKIQWRRRTRIFEIQNDVDVDVRQPDDENNDIFSVHIDTIHNGNDDDQKSVDFSMFLSKGNECGGNNKENGITSNCDALQRLGAALRAYDVLNRMEHGVYNGNDDEVESEIPTFSEFIGSEYRVQFLEDFNHFMAEHQYFGEDVKEEMIEKYGLKRCNALECELTMRHFGGRRAANKSVRKKENIRSKFYRQKFDSLHFHIFHLEESGYRYRSKLKQNERKESVDVFESKVQEERDEEQAIDRDLAEEMSAVNDNKKKCDFGRFVGDGPNKYTLSVSAKAWMEHMFEYVKSRGIPQSVINKAKIWILKEAYDSDAIQEDANEISIQTKDSSLCSHVNHQALSKSIADFVEMTKVPTFSVGLRFIYWEKCKGYKRREFLEDDSLFIDKKSAKFKDIKEELLESGHCDIFAFKVIDAKCSDLMLCKKVRAMYARGDGTKYNPGYGMKYKDPITRRHVECVVVYCDLTDFSAALSATFRQEFVGESIESVKERNRSYYHVSKGLREAVECFGKNGMDEVGPFYCGINCLLLLTQFGIHLNGPTSTSKSRAVAIRFAGESGVVLKMNNEDEYLHFFDCVPFSQFPEEDERLFIGGRFPLLIQSVLVMETAQNFARFFGVLSVFDCVVSGVWLQGNNIPPKKDHSKLDHLMKWSLGKLEDSAATFPDFVYQTFNCFRRRKREIFMKLYLMDQEFLKVYTQFIVHSLAEREWTDDDVIGTEIDWSSLFGIFPNVQKVTIVCDDGKYGFNLRTFLQKLCNEVFPEHLNLESVVLKSIGWGGRVAFKVQEEQLREHVDPTVFNLCINDLHKDLYIIRI